VVGLLSRVFFFFVNNGFVMSYNKYFVDEVEFLYQCFNLDL